MRADIYLENMIKMFGKSKFDEAIENLIKHYTSNNNNSNNTNNSHFF